ncbi:MAG: hypothetical protein R3B97_02245 [Dehalococcoidia bacterium]
MRWRKCNEKSSLRWRRSSWMDVVQSKSSSVTRSSKPAWEESSFELLGIAALDLVGQDERQEGGIVELKARARSAPSGRVGIVWPS